MQGLSPVFYHEESAQIRKRKRSQYDYACITVNGKVVITGITFEMFILPSISHPVKAFIACFIDSRIALIAYAQIGFAQAVVFHQFLAAAFLDDGAGFQHINALRKA